MSKIATIGAVYDDGVTLIFPGETRASTKRYKVNTSASFSAGDRVKVWENAGTYVVEYKIGNKAEGAGGSGAVSSVNGKTGAVELAASDVGAVSSTYQSAINSNTSARHTHSNRTVLNGITAAKVAQWDAASGGSSAPGRNLLDNPWFTVNQRGVTSWSSKYGVDRWRIVSGSAQITDDGLVVNGTVRQILEKDPGETVCASVRMSSGTATATYDATTKYFDIVSSGGTVRAAKLELGTESTIDDDEAPEYMTELLKCQRFFFAMPASGEIPLSGYLTNSSKTYRIGVPVPVLMRGTPTIEYAGACPVVFRGSAGYLKLGSSSGVSIGTFSVSQVSSNMLRLERTLTTSQGDTNNIAFSAAVSVGSYLGFSADL